MKEGITLGIYKVIQIKVPKNWRLHRFQYRKYKKYRKNTGKGLQIPLRFFLAFCIVFLLVFSFRAWMGKRSSVIDTMVPRENNVENGEHKQGKGLRYWGKTIFFREVLPYFDEYIPDAEESMQAAAKAEPEEKAEIITYDNMDMLQSLEDLKRYMYTVDAKAYVTEKELNSHDLITTPVSCDIRGSSPKVLIFHTHSQEDFKDSVPGETEDTIVGVGQTLAEILAEKYNVCVVHDVGVYDMKDGKLDRGNSYENMEPNIQKVLEKYPSIEVVIDLHRDGVNEDVHLVTDINGKPTAKIMFFNGVCQLNDNGVPKATEGLSNPYIKENLAFSFRMQAMANTLYPGFTRKIYIKPYRYSLHMKPLSLLVEAGANTNTVEEVKNAMEPLAKILVSVLEGENV